MDEMLATGPMLLDRLEDQPQDSLIALIALANADPRPEKIDVGVGVYRDAAGNTPILKSVKAAERSLVETQATKAYIGSQGDVRFVELIKPIVFGADAADDGRIVGLQTPGGCGALRLGAELIARANPLARIFAGEPTWPNHAPLIASAGVEMVGYPYYARDSRDDLLRSDDGGARRGRGGRPRPAPRLLPQSDRRRSRHGPVARGRRPRSPTRGLIPFVDLAYQGFGDGLEADAAGTRLVVEAAEQAIVAQSCDKNFSCYRDRVGTLFVKASSARGAEIAFGNLLGLARTMWSMPPDHRRRGCPDHPRRCRSSRPLWEAEVEAMGARIRDDPRPARRLRPAARLYRGPEGDVLDAAAEPGRR